jgi:hypothetical protein
VRILAVVIAISLIAFLTLSYYAGLFDKMDITMSEAAGPYNLVFREHKGSYRGVRAALYDVSRYLSEKRSITPRRGFAVYYDNPRKKKQEDLRSIGGYITDSLLSDLPAPFIAAVFPRTRSVMGIFPFRSFLSPMTGPMKFYPEMAKIRIKQKCEMAGPVMEIYDVPAKRIVYIAPVN